MIIEYQLKRSKKNFKVCGSNFPVQSQEYLLTILTVFIVNFEHISQLFLVLLLMTLSR